MDRLTNPNLTRSCCDPWDYCGLDKDCRRDCKGCKLPAQIYRLAMYEDSGFEPEEIAALLGQQAKTATPVRKRQRVETSVAGDYRDVNKLLAGGWQVVHVTSMEGFTSATRFFRPYTEYLLEREETDG